MKTLCREIKCPWFKEQGSYGCQRYPSAYQCHLLGKMDSDIRSDAMLSEYAIAVPDSFKVSIIAALADQNDEWLAQDEVTQRRLANGRSLPGDIP